MEKETLEEVAERLQKDKYGIFISKNADVKGQLVIDTAKAAFLSGMKEGAKYQAERMYSEEDMIEFGFSTYCYISELMGVPFNLISENRVNAEDWFEQFKKK
jgi:predicted GTPase